MRRSASRVIRSLTLWSAVFAALVLLFRYAAPTPAEALIDERTTLYIQTDGGIVETTAADYLPYVVAAEIPVSYGPEALKAQAVAARTYILASDRHSGANVCTDSACCLAYLSEAELRDRWGSDYDADLAAVRAAVTATDGQVLTYGGELILAAFHASSDGQTEDSAAVWAPLPYLVAVETPETAETVPGLASEAVFSPEELAERLGLSADTPPEAWLEGSELDDAGRVRYLRVGGQSLSGGFVRRALGLRSTDFTVRYADGAFIFTVRGYGHGVGMSQEGARLLAADGWSYEEILAHYYPGTELTLLPPQVH